MQAVQVTHVQVVSVHDGDTFKVIIDGQVKVVRLCGIDAPELKQPLGEQAKQALRSRLPERVTLWVSSTDRYGRLVADVMIADQHVNQELVRSGAVWHYPQYSAGCVGGRSVFQNAETEAKKFQRGIWEPAPIVNIPPWEWRNRK